MGRHSATNRLTIDAAMNFTCRLRENVVAAAAALGRASLRWDGKSTAYHIKGWS